jgi:hypothetical protein
VTSVSDAATLTLRCAGSERTVALAGVTAPRPGPPLHGGEPFGDGSAAAASEMLAGRAVRVSDSRVTFAGADLRLALLERGLVRVRTGFTSPALVAAERSARAAQRGLWSLEVWQRHHSAVTVPLDLPPQGPPPPTPLGVVADRLARRDRAARRQAFDAALAELAQREGKAARQRGDGAPQRRR